MPEAKRRSTAVLVIVSFFVLLTLVLFAFNRFTFAPKIIVLIVIILTAAVLGKARIFLQDWFVFISAIYLFDSLRGTIYILICKLKLPVFAVYVLKMEKALFGKVPSFVLQDGLLKSDTASGFSWVEKLLTVLHGSHFVAFLLVGFLIWVSRPVFFRVYKTAFYLVTALGLAGYLFVPTVPPWMASSLFNLLPRIIRFNRILYNVAIPDISSGFDVNPIAAMPSLHAAFPILCALLLWRLYRWKAMPIFIYTGLLIFAIVYSGDHYVVDIIAGLILAFLCYGLAVRSGAIALRKRTPEADRPPEKASEDLNLRLAFGGLLLLAGILLGTYNISEFKNKVNDYNFYVPRYVDFFRGEDLYRENFAVQFYLGNYNLFHQDFPKARLYLEKALALSKNEDEKKRAATGLEYLRQIAPRGNRPEMGCP